MGDATEACLKGVLKGAIPIQLCLATTDASSSFPVPPLFIMVSRYSYLSEAVKEHVAYFRTKAIEFSAEVWFEHEGQVLKSHWPVGLLYDSTSATPTALPWAVTVHFQAASSKVLPSAQQKRLFFHSLKQALHLLRGDLALYFSLSVEEQGQIWRACEQGPKDRVTGKLCPNSAQEAKSIPLRVLVHPAAGFVLRQCRPLNADGSPKTLEQALVNDFHLRLETVIVQGIPTPLHAPIFELWRLFHYLDLFLYVCVWPQQPALDSPSS